MLLILRDTLTKTNTYDKKNINIPEKLHLVQSDMFDLLYCLHVLFPLSRVQFVIIFPQP